MDNKAYLDQIAVKGRSAKGGTTFFTPLIIKLIAAGVVLLIMFLVVGSILSNHNKQISQKFEALYLRTVSLVDDESPFITYGDDVKSPSLRQYNVMLLTSLKNFNNSYGALLETVKVDAENPTTSVSDENATVMSQFEADVKEGYLKGTIDHNFGASAYYQINLLIGLEREARSVTTNQQVADVIDKLHADLEDLQAKYKDFSRNN